MVMESVNQSSCLVETMEVAKKYAKDGHTVQIRLMDFGKRSAEHMKLEWEVWVDFDYYLCARCRNMRDKALHGVAIKNGLNYCLDCINAIGEG